MVSKAAISACLLTFDPLECYVQQAFYSVHYAGCFLFSIFKTQAAYTVSGPVKPGLYFTNRHTYCAIAKCTVTCRPVSWIGHSPWKLPVS